MSCPLRVSFFHIQPWLKTESVSKLAAFIPLSLSYSVWNHYNLRWDPFKIFQLCCQGKGPRLSRNTARPTLRNWWGWGIFPSNGCLYTHFRPQERLVRADLALLRGTLSERFTQVSWWQPLFPNQMFPFHMDLSMLKLNPCSSIIVVKKTQQFLFEETIPCGDQQAGSFWRRRGQRDGPCTWCRVRRRPSRTRLALVLLSWSQENKRPQTSKYPFVSRYCRRRWHGGWHRQVRGKGRTGPEG